MFDSLRNFSWEPTSWTARPQRRLHTIESGMVVARDDLVANVHAELSHSVFGIHAETEPEPTMLIEHLMVVAVAPITESLEVCAEFVTPETHVVDVVNLGSDPWLLRRAALAQPLDGLHLRAANLFPCPRRDELLVGAGALLVGPLHLV